MSTKRKPAKAINGEIIGVHLARSGRKSWGVMLYLRNRGGFMLIDNLRTKAEACKNLRTLRGRIAESNAAWIALRGLADAK